MNDRSHSDSPNITALVRRGLLRRSEWALKLAITCLETDGIGGALVIHIPESPGERPEIRFYPGAPEVWVGEPRPSANPSGPTVNGRS